ncbi:30S ribosomal protein S6 [Mucisphaera calidilacus]|uniref:Small ribosomal subunit protein bS6 n=1 Tax=Mucisphaera calidilacus TaxID=2527982 RepID=A0A518BYU5_9BACT|nr:30S ribosomal protein S6 [Mucisphaera calidilacus]QDU72140.1 30S ribosomal protein S6 [Mucisphaera calidilacus]
MSDTAKVLYEAMFLAEQGAVATDFGGVVDHIRGLLERAEADIVVFRKWEERRLAYTINGQKRGTFFLALFKAPPAKLMDLENDCRLSEIVLRQMVLKADYMGETEIELALKDAEGAAELEAKLRDRREETPARSGAESLAVQAKPVAPAEEQAEAPQAEAETAVAEAEQAPAEDDTP